MACIILFQMEVPIFMLDRAGKWKTNPPVTLDGEAVELLVKANKDLLINNLTNQSTEYMLKENDRCDSFA